MQRRGSRRVRYAVVGLGHIAQVAALPAFEHARKNSELVALVSDDKKRTTLARRYRVSRAYSYDEYDACCGGRHRRRLHRAAELDAPRVRRASRARRRPRPVREADGRRSRLSGDDRAPPTARREAHDRLPPALRGGEPARAVELAVGPARRAPALRLRLHHAGARRGTSVSRRSAAAARSTTSASTASTPRATCSGRAREVMAVAVRGQRRRASRRSRKRRARSSFPDDRLATSRAASAPRTSRPTAWSAPRAASRRAGLRVRRGAPQRWWGGARTVRTYPVRDQFAPELLYFSRLHPGRTRPSHPGPKSSTTSGHRGDPGARRDGGAPQAHAPGAAHQTPRAGPGDSPQPPVRKPHLVKAASR